MEMAIAAGSYLVSLVSGTGTATAAAGTATAAAGTAATSSIGSTMASILQGGIGLIGAMGAVRAGQAQADAYRAQASDTLLASGQDAIDQTNRETSLRKSLIAALGERDTAYAASGVDLSFGTPQAARAAAIEDANAVTSSDTLASKTRQAQLRARADNLTAMADDAASSGWLKGAGSLLTSGFDIIKRG